MGPVRPARTISSKTWSSAMESDAPGCTTGRITLSSVPKASDAMRISWLRIQFTLPRRVLISPLCASVRNGWASRHSGNVFVE